MWLAVRRLMAVCSSRSGSSAWCLVSPAIRPSAELASVRPSSTLFGTIANSAPFFTCSTLLENSGTPLFHDSRSTSGKIVPSSTVVVSCGSQGVVAGVGAGEQLRIQLRRLGQVGRHVGLQFQALGAGRLARQLHQPLAFLR